MNITKVKIDNFRCFDKTEVDFGKYHALVGENGTGKTAVLEAINLATSLGGSSTKINEQDFNNLDARDELSIEVQFDELFIMQVTDGYTTRNIPSECVILKAKRREKVAAGKALSQQFVVSQFVVPFEYTTENKPTITKDGVEIDIPPFIRKTTDGYETVRKNGNALELSERGLGMTNDLIKYPNIFYFSKEREKESRTGFSTLFKKISTDLNWRYRYKWDQQEIVDSWNKFYSEVIKTVEDPKTGRIVNPLRTKLEEFVGKKFSDLEISLLDLEQPFSKAFFSLRSGTNIIEQSGLGSGISILLSYFLLELISKLSKEEIIFLIDEPELHLHPQLQQKLLETFEDANQQIIYTTQSDCMVNIAQWQNVSRFCKDHSIHPSLHEIDAQLENKKISEHLNEIKKWHQHETIFFREDNQIFFSKKCVLVEGPAEKYGIPVLAKKLNINLRDITLISCNGKAKIPYYQLICKSFGIPYFTLIDLDNKSETDEENKRPLNWADSTAISKFNSSFETILGTNSSNGHKASETLTKIDTIDTEEVPQEIKDAIILISNWNSID